VKKPSWINRLKKTAPELPYQPPIWLGDHSNGEHYHQITPEERRMRELILREGAERARYYGMERREFHGQRARDCVLHVGDQSRQRLQRGQRKHGWLRSQRGGCGQRRGRVQKGCDGRHERAARSGQVRRGASILRHVHLRRANTSRRSHQSSLRSVSHVTATRPLWQGPVRLLFQGRIYP